MKTMRGLTTSVRAQTSQLAAIALNEKLAAMTKPSEILNAFAASGERFNGVNLATTISRLGRAHRAHHARICSSDEFRTLVRVVARQSQEVGFFHTRQFAKRLTQNTVGVPSDRPFSTLIGDGPVSLPRIASVASSCSGS